MGVSDAKFFRERGFNLFGLLENKLVVAEQNAVSPSKIKVEFSCVNLGDKHSNQDDENQ
jgi:hypothetical protein